MAGYIPRCSSQPSADFSHPREAYSLTEPGDGKHRRFCPGANGEQRGLPIIYTRRTRREKRGVASLAGYTPGCSCQPSADVSHPREAYSLREPGDGKHSRFHPGADTQKRGLVSSTWRRTRREDRGLASTAGQVPPGCQRQPTRTSRTHLARNRSENWAFSNTAASSRGQGREAMPRCHKVEKSKYHHPETGGSRISGGRHAGRSHPDRTENTKKNHAELWGIPLSLN